MILKDNPLKNMAWPRFTELPGQEKARFLNRGNKPYHALMSQQFDRALLDRIGDLATKTRKIAKTRGGMNFLQGLLSEKRVMLYFAQPSTRTFLSFYAACQILGIKPAEVRDASTSSEIKGESQEDSVRTFSSYFDMIIMRHPVGGFAERIAWLLSQTDRPVPVVNAGSGKDQHPTQALLDIYTLQRSLEKRRGGLEGARIAFVGDLARGRTVRSLSMLLRHYPGVHQVFVAPPALQIGEDILKKLDEAGMTYEVTPDFERIIPEVDAIYMTRIQDEWDKAGESGTVDTSGYHFTAAHLEALQPHAILMHPLPRRQEIAPEVDGDPRAKYWRQVRNGMWVRAVLILMIFDRDGEIDRYYEDLMS
ncbi:MAG TPA: aspartate carbamoyltransferase [Kiritimatiellia bacterium]|nr:aspartate carbamoyltransferase [Kiritimatiellia bacterium]HMO98940.1 aspartate carbamoyltransferase [Kiritimatiellia bacterium]HMP95727.1 aspartate carbamoyltransferase [Kiritimatiellia bacterium]